MQKYTPYKKSFDHSYTFGIFPTLELLSAKPNVVEAVFLAPNSSHSQGVQKIRAICRARGIACTEDAKIMQRLTKDDHCFSVGVFKKFSGRLESEKSHVVLVNPDDAGNLGTIMRTMLGFDYANLAIIRPSVDAFDPKVVRASMGAIFKQNIAYYDSIDDYRSEFDRHLYPFMLQTDNTLSETVFTPPYGLVFGNEGSGLSDEYKQIGSPVRVEQSNDIDSLNLAVSVGIALYTAYRARI